MIHLHRTTHEEELLCELAAKRDEACIRMHVGNAAAVTSRLTIQGKRRETSRKQCKK
jgi:hypothetical protein